MEDKIIFEDYGIEFSDEDFEGVSEETLKLCKAKVAQAIKGLEKKGDK